MFNLLFVNLNMSDFVLFLGDEESIGSDSDNPLMMLFNEIYHFTDPTGRALSEPFLRLPSRRFVLFFQICHIFFAMIREIIELNTYIELSQRFSSDVHACTYNVALIQLY